MKYKELVTESKVWIDLLQDISINLDIMIFLDFIRVINKNIVNINLDN